MSKDHDEISLMIDSMFDWTPVQCNAAHFKMDSILSTAVLQIDGSAYGRQVRGVDTHSDYAKDSFCHIEGRKSWLWLSKFQRAPKHFMSILFYFCSLFFFCSLCYSCVYLRVGIYRSHGLGSLFVFSDQVKCVVSAFITIYQKMCAREQFLDKGDANRIVQPVCLNRNAAAALSERLHRFHLNGLSIRSTRNRHEVHLW